MNGTDPETEAPGKPVEIQIPSGKESVFAEKMAKVKRVIADLTGSNENHRKQRVSEILAAEKSTARKHTLLDAREYMPMRQQVAYMTADGKQMERSVVVYFRKTKDDMSIEYATDDNGVRLAFDAELYDAAPESGVYESVDKKHKARTYPVFGENLAIERTVTIFENDLEYREETVSAGEEIISPVGEKIAELEEDVLTRDSELIRKNPGLVAWFYGTCQGLINEKDMTKRQQQYNEARKKLEDGGMPGDLLNLITGSSELILAEAELDTSKSRDKAGEIAKGAAVMSSVFEGALRDRADFLRLRIMVAESGGEMRKGDKQFLTQLKSELEVLQKQVRLKKGEK